MTSGQTKHSETPMADSLQPVMNNSHEASGEMPDSPPRSSKGSIQTVSTATYERQEQEAEDAFNLRIEKLCQDLWPAPTSIKHRFSNSQAAARLRANRFFCSFVPTPQMPLIQHFKGGGFNHITSSTLPASYIKGHRNLILRVPREDGSRPDQQVAVLNYVRQRTLIPVATIEATDFTCDNAVGRPYVLQQRIPGRDLDSVWDDLNHSQRCVVAKEVGRLIANLLSLESPYAGTIEPATNDSYISTETPIIVPFKLPDALGDSVEQLKPNSATGARKSLTCETTLELFEYCLSHWRKCALEESLGEIGDDVILYDNMLKAVRKMDQLGLFKPDLYCLCHLDLHPRNIMVDVGPEDSIRVTGILDWDEAVIAPKFVNCQPPGWLWGYDKDTHTENSLLPWPYELEGANNTPETIEQRELKRIFDDNAGPEYPRLAYDQSSRLMRGLYRVATLGLTANWHYTAAERIVEEWKVVRPTLAPNFEGNGVLLR
ncbi:hypothetical protein P7C71_g2056, partial [Lecanoromycetidae sp. Uapishka_2]